MGLFGTCKNEYFVVDQGDHLKVTKTYDMDTCSYKGGIYKTRSNIPKNMCTDPNVEDQTISSRIGNYNLDKKDKAKYLLTTLDALMRTNVQTALSYYPQFFYSSVVMELIDSNGTHQSNQDINLNDGFIVSPLTFVRPLEEATGGRSPKNMTQLIKRTAKMLIKLAENLNLDKSKPNFFEPFDDSASELIRLLGTMDLPSLKKLYDEIDIGTSYKQETARNLFIEIIPRSGTKHTVLLLRDMIVDKSVKSATAVELLVALPFNVAEPSYELVKECEVFLNLGPDRPDVKHVALLSYATLIYKTYISVEMSDDQFEYYVKKYFDLFLNSVDYDEQIIYLQALGNLQLGNVVDYLEPIIRSSGYPQTTDLRFLSVWATFGTAYLRPDQVFNTYWPIFRSKTEPLQLRLGAFVMLLVSNPSSGRLLALFDTIINEKDPHMINFYRTTILSLTDSTYSCYQGLRKFLSYMRRSLPKKPLSRYWPTGKEN